ncbi:MAG: alpha-amylase [Bacteroidetes bacterium]|jgi:glycosidase|nr:alpha-amylase [Bacteroidota bacterium]
MRTLLFFALLALLWLPTGCDAPAPPSSDPAVADTTAAPAWADDAVIYELFVRDFTPEGTFRAIIPRLPDLQALGVTTIWLMPIHPIGEKARKGTLGSPYAVRDYKTVNPNFGTKADFQALVDSVHAAGMTLILDFVANHTAQDHPWVTERPEWYTKDSTGAVTHPPGTDWTDVADLDYSHPEVRAAMIDAMRYWVAEHDVDGYRCDVAELVPQDFWDAAIDTLRAVKPVMMLAEGADPWLHDVGFDVTYGWNTYQALKAIWDGAPADTLYAVLEDEAAHLPDDALRMRFTTNHDETAWDAPPVDLFDGLDGARAAAVAALTLPGLPLLYNGQEVGSPQRLRLFEKDTIDFSQNPAMRAFYADLLGLYQRRPALHDGTLTPLARDADVLLHERRADDDRVIVAVNVRPDARAIALPPALTETTFTDAVTGERLPASDTLSLPPYGARLLTPQPGATP